jgi:hypothetical protein
VKLPPVGWWMCFFLLRFAYTTASRLEFSFCNATLNEIILWLKADG